MINCYFCGSNIETMQEDFSDMNIRFDRYFKDKEDEKIICKVCGPYYMKRQFSDLNPESIDIVDFEKFVLERFDKVMLEKKLK